MAFIDQGEFEAMKMLTSCRGPRCDKHQFCAKMTVNTQTIFEISLLNLVVLQERKKEYEKWHFHDRTLLGLAVFRVDFGHFYESC